MTDWTELAETIVDLLRRQNWKNGGVLSIDHGDALSLVTQALRAAEATGAASAAKDTGESMLAAFDRYVNPVSAAVAQGRAPTMDEVAAIIQPEEQACG